MNKQLEVEYMEEVQLLKKLIRRLQADKLEQQIVIDKLSDNQPVVNQAYINKLMGKPFKLSIVGKL